MLKGLRVCVFLLTKHSSLTESIPSCHGSSKDKATSFTPFYVKRKQQADVCLSFHVNMMLNLFVVMKSTPKIRPKIRLFLFFLTNDIIVSWLCRRVSYTHYFLPNKIPGMERCTIHSVQTTELVFISLLLSPTTNFCCISPY